MRDDVASCEDGNIRLENVNVIAANRNSTHADVKRKKNVCSRVTKMICADVALRDVTKFTSKEDV